MISLAGEAPYGNEKEKQKTVKVAIVDAKYFKEEGWLVVNVLTPENERRSCTLPTLNRYKGKLIGAAEAHMRMEETAEMFNKRRGSFITVTCDEGQIRKLPEERIQS